MAVLFKKRAIPVKPVPKPGDVITWDNKEWLVCHYDNNNNQVYLISKDIISTTYFDLNHAWYSGSKLAQTAMNYQNNNMSAAALEMCIDVTVGGVTSKVFVPEYQHFNGGFSWFNSDANRVAYYQGTAKQYWTSSPDGSNRDWYISSNGELGGSAEYGYEFGFRPCVCVQL